MAAAPPLVTVRVTVVNTLPAIIAALPGACDDLAHRVADQLKEDAQSTSPVLEGYLRAEHEVEQVELGRYEISVQKYEGGDRGRRYALFVNFGTVFMAAQPWFSDACAQAAVNLLTFPLALPEGL